MNTQSTKTRKTKGTPNETDKHVGRRLRLRRSIIGISQEKLADAVGITFQQIQKYEKGINRISAGRLWELTDVIGVDVSYFFTGLSDHGKGMTSTENITTQEIKHLMQWRNLSPSVRVRMSHLINAVVNDE